MPLTTLEIEHSFGTKCKVLHGCRQLVPWGVGLSPATSATPILSCQHVMVGTLGRLPAQAERKEGTTSSHHGPYAQGYTRATMVHTEGRKLVIASQSQKVHLSSDWGLQLDPMKLESLVIAYQQWRGEYVPGPCTHRPSSHGNWEDLKTVAARRCLGLNQWLGLSRNKVAVPEGVAGTPPFWRPCATRFVILYIYSKY
jgi:hypothetical protein